MGGIAFSPSPVFGFRLPAGGGGTGGRWGRKRRGSGGEAAGSDRDAWYTYPGCSAIGAELRGVGCYVPVSALESVSGLYIMAIINRWRWLTLPCCCSPASVAPSLADILHGLPAGLALHPSRSGSGPAGRSH